MGLGFVFAKPYRKLAALENNLLSKRLSANLSCEFRLTVL